MAETEPEADQEAMRRALLKGAIWDAATVLCCTYFAYRAFVHKDWFWPGLLVAAYGIMHAAASATKILQYAASR